MEPETTTTRQWYFWPLVALIAGLLLGLLVGWVIWPVSYKNALPQDLRPAERDSYLSLVAESFAQSGNLDQAKERLSTWPTEELNTALSNLQDRLIDTDARLAGDVQNLASALNLQLAQPAQPTPAPTSAASGAKPLVSSQLLRTVCTAVLWLLLILAGIVGLIWLYNWWRRSAQRRAPAPVIRESVREVERAVGLGPRSADEIAEEAKLQPLAPAGGRTTYVEPERPPARWVEARGDEPSPASQPRAEAPRPTYVEPSAPPVESPRRVVAPAVPTPTAASAPVKLGDYVAIYQMGEPDYDEAFDINDPVEGTMGQCGLQLIDPVGRNRDQAVALQVWLWDGSDPDTRVKVLMSEGGYRDTALRSAQAGSYEAIPVRAGGEFELESHDLLLRGRVDKVEYADAELPRSIFVELHVRLQAYRKA